jgi:GxxExxY protein
MDNKINHEKISLTEKPLLSKEQQDNITHKIIGCAMEVHNTLGNGFQEVVYQRCLSIELNENQVQHQREVEMPIFYKGEEVGLRRADFLIMDEIMVELKAITVLEATHLAQAMNYLEAYNLQTGLLINFGARILQFKRIFNKSWNPIKLQKNQFEQNNTPTNKY